MPLSEVNSTLSIMVYCEQSFFDFLGFFFFFFFFVPLIARLVALFTSNVFGGAPALYKQTTYKSSVRVTLLFPMFFFFFFFFCFSNFFL